MEYAGYMDLPVAWENLLQKSNFHVIFTFSQSFTYFWFLSQIQRACLRFSSCMQVLIGNNSRLMSEGFHVYYNVITNSTSPYYNYASLQL
jgi:hypothetical protein